MKMGNTLAELYRANNKYLSWKFRILYLKHSFLSIFCGFYILSPYLCRNKDWGQKDYYNICKCYECITREPSVEENYRGRLKFYKIWKIRISKERAVDPILNWFRR